MTPALLDSQQMIAQAQRDTGLADWGRSGFLRHLEVQERDRERHGKSGRHSYSAEKVALDMERLNRHWGPYIERYKVPLER